jgi:site-specific recombinase XerD
VFTNAIGQFLRPDLIYRHYKRIVASIGIESRLHATRHTYATTALANGVDVKDVQESLGHHDAGFTLNRYGHVTEKQKQDNADKMNVYYRSIKKS